MENLHIFSSKTPSRKIERRMTQTREGRLQAHELVEDENDWRALWLWEATGCGTNKIKSTPCVNQGPAVYGRGILEVIHLR